MIVAGILTPLENALRAILDWLGPHGTIGLPWGWSIVALTILVRIALVPLTVRQIHSMQNLQAHAPQMKEIQRKYKGDRAKQNEELMKFYRENNINPAASCLPLVAQIPVFLGLYYTLNHFAHHPPGGKAALERGEDPGDDHAFAFVRSRRSGRTAAGAGLCPAGGSPTTKTARSSRPSGGSGRRCQTAPRERRRLAGEPGVPPRWKILWSSTRSTPPRAQG